MRFIIPLLLLTTVARAEPLRRISICDGHNSPKTRLAKGGWTFCDGEHWLTENEFIRQYQRATGLHDLDAQVKLRPRTRWIVAAVLGAVGLGVMTYGLATLRRPCTADDVHELECIGPKQKIIYGNSTWSVYSETAAALGGAAFAGATVIFFVGPGRDGSPTDHGLNRLAADLMVKRYQAGLQLVAHF